MWWTRWKHSLAKFILWLATISVILEASSPFRWKTKYTKHKLYGTVSQLLLVFRYCIRLCSVSHVSDKKKINSFNRKRRRCAFHIDAQKRHISNAWLLIYYYECFQQDAFNLYSTATFLKMNFITILLVDFCGKYGWICFIQSWNQRLSNVNE